MGSDLAAALQYLTWATYLATFASVGVRAIRVPTEAHFDMLVFFGAAAWLSLGGAAQAALALTLPVWLNDLNAIVLVGLAYLLLRLVGDFSQVPLAVQRGAELGLALSAVAIVVWSSAMPTEVALLVVAYFVALVVYDTVAFVQAARRSPGVTQRRFWAIAVGSVCVALVILLAGLSLVAAALSGLFQTLAGVAGLASGLAYFVGFAPPTWLRRAWQEPQLRAFLAHSGRLVREPDIRRVVGELEETATMAIGASVAIGLWDSQRDVLRFFFSQRPPPSAADLGDVDPDQLGFTIDEAERTFELRPGVMVAGQTFQRGRALFTRNTVRADPRHEAFYRAMGSLAAMAAPIDAADQRLGVMIAFASRAPVFAQSDLELVRLLADQIAVVLQNRLLVDEAARARAREEADQLKDEFLSAMSHDLRNPLAAVQGTVQVLARRLQRAGQIDPERLAAALGSIGASTAQMSGLIDQILDYARLRMDRPLDLDRRPTDLVALARRVVEVQAGASERHQLRLEAAEPSIAGDWDAPRLERVVQNLLANAVKYSPAGGEVVARLGVEEQDGRRWAVLSVHDHGLGIPADELPRVFEQFYRGANVVGRISGTGIGLAAARQIVEQHGGGIEASSQEGAGSVFTVRLPLSESGP